MVRRLLAFWFVPVQLFVFFWCVLIAPRCPAKTGSREGSNKTTLSCWRVKSHAKLADKKETGGGGLGRLAGCLFSCKPALSCFESQSQLLFVTGLVRFRPVFLRQPSMECTGTGVVLLRSALNHTYSRRTRRMDTCRSLFLWRFFSFFFVVSSLPSLLLPPFFRTVAFCQRPIFFQGLLQNVTDFPRNSFVFKYALGIPREGTAKSVEKGTLYHTVKGLNTDFDGRVSFFVRRTYVLLENVFFSPLHRIFYILAS